MGSYGAQPTTHRPLSPPAPTTAVAPTNSVPQATGKLSSSINSGNVPSDVAAQIGAVTKTPTVTPTVTPQTSANGLCPCPKADGGVVTREHRETGGGINHLHVPHIRPKRIHRSNALRYVRHHTGAIHSSVAGRTDHLPIHVPNGSYVLPADIVSHFGENNTSAGFKILHRMFGGVPRGGGEQPYNHTGGPYGMADGGKSDGVPIVAAGGEYVIHPHHVRQIGNGDIDLGHKVLDEFVKRIRKDLVETLKKLPGPRKD